MGSTSDLKYMSVTEVVQTGVSRRLVMQAIHSKYGRGIAVRASHGNSKYYINIDRFTKLLEKGVLI